MNLSGFFMPSTPNMGVIQGKQTLNHRGRTPRSQGLLRSLQEIHEQMYHE